MRRANFTKLGDDIGRTWLRKKFVFAFGYLVAFPNAGGSKLSDSRVMLKTTPNFALVDPLCENKGSAGRDLYTNC